MCAGQADSGRKPSQLVTRGSVKVRRGFRYIQRVTAFQHVAQNEVIAQVRRVLIRSAGG